MIFACCLAAMGIKRFYDKRVSWRATVLIAALSCAGLAFFMVVQDNMLDADPDLFAGPVDSDRDDAETGAAGPRPQKPRRAARRHHHHPDSRHPCRSLRLRAAPGRRRRLDDQFQWTAGRHDPGAGVPVDGVEFRFPADGDGPAAQRGRRPRAARRSHRRRQPAASAAAADRGMRQVGAQRRAVRAAGDRSRRLQGHQRYPWPRRGRCLPAAFHADGADPVAARRHAGAHRRRRILHRAAGQRRCARAR